jgi:hypothetical protein
MDDIVGLGKIAEAGERFTREFRELLRDFLQPTVREAGGWLGDHLRIYRQLSLFKALRLAHAKIEASGLSRSPLTVKDAVLLIEGASLEDDDYLTSKWAGLIAGAATGERPLPAFADILRQLTPEEARILDRLYENAPHRPTGWVQHIENKEDLQRWIGLDNQEFLVRIQNLQRLELIVEQRPIIGRQPTRGMEGWQETGPTGLTALGAAFVRACRGPAERDVERI